MMSCSSSVWQLLITPTAAAAAEKKNYILSMAVLELF
jgi:hypothetical protein